MIKVFSVPPKTPTTKVRKIANGIGKCASRHNAHHNRRKSHHRTDRKIDSARNNDRCHHEREQTDLDRKTRNFKPVSGSKKIVARKTEKRDFDEQNDEQNPFVIRKKTR